MPQNITVYSVRQLCLVAWFVKGASAAMEGVRALRLHMSFQHIGALQAPVRRPIPGGLVLDDTCAIASRHGTRIRG
jgi:hypothetical protein